MRNSMFKSITTLAFVCAAGFAAGALAQPKPLVLKPNAPERYIVVSGDTLWSIAERYTDSPWRWTELWNMNKATTPNPHRIYPGDVLVIDRARGQLAVAADTVKLSPRIRAERIEEKAIPSIPPNVIEPYLSRPLVIEPNGLDRAPTIVATQDNRVVLGAGNTAYVSGLGGSTEDSWHIYRQGGALTDPETGRVMGYEATYLGAARVRKAGEPAALEIVTAVREIGVGDKLVAAGRPQAPNYAPHAPAAQMRGQVISIVGSVGSTGESGRNSVVTLNRGQADGIEVGHVLALYRADIAAGRALVGARMQSAGMAADAAVKLPEERYGLVMVFRVFERVSYALVMNISKPVRRSDIVQNP